MHPRVQQLVQALRLQPHPEGGFYGEVFRSTLNVLPADDRDARPALTTIYFLLARGMYSRWHRVRSDEVWHFYEGSSLDLWEMPADLSRCDRVALGVFDEAIQPVHVVPAGCWQAARSTGDYTLVGCSVGPGFIFDDFEMMRPDAPEASLVRERWPSAADLL
jgi:predicted cupin superfamily sugar epimerase